MKVKDLITKLQKLEKTTSGEVSFKLASPNWAEGDILHELDLSLLCFSAIAHKFTYNFDNMI